MGRMAGPDPLFRSRRSILTVHGRPGREESTPRCWLADQPGQRKTRRHPGGLPGGINVRVGAVDLLRHLPNILTSPSEASKKEAVSTPSLVTGTAANDCTSKGISKVMANEIGICYLDRFEVWRYRGHLLFLCLRCRLWSRYSRPHGCLVASRAVFGAGTPGERRTFLIRSGAKVIRSDRQRLVLSDSLVGQSARRFGVPVHSPMARVYANVNALSGPIWYDYGP